MTSISDTVAAADVQRRAEGQIAQPFARPRPHLPDPGGAAAPRRHSLYLLRSHRPEVVLRLRHDRARHRQFLHGDVLFPVGPVRMAGHRAEGPAELFERSPASARPALRGLRAHSHSARLLRHRPAAPSRVGFSEFWWTTVTEGPWPSGPIWFLWVLLGFDLVACLLYRLSPNMLDPINRLSLHGRRRPAVFSLSCLPSPLRSTFPD